MLKFILTLSSVHWADVEVHPDIKKNFWDQQTWPKYVLVRYTWYKFYGSSIRMYNFVFPGAIHEEQILLKFW
jgi:hypothetical protein